MDIFIPTFFMVIGVYYIKTYSDGKEFDRISARYEEEVVRKKCKIGKVGGYALLLLAMGGYALAFIKR